MQENIQPGQAVDITQNIFVENKGEWSLYASATNMIPFNGTIHNNHFNRNQNYRDSLIVTTPHFHMIDNEFEQFKINNKHTYKEVSYSIDNALMSYLSVRI